MNTTRRRRDETLNAVAEDVVALVAHGVTRVAIDGVDGAGKTVFADELAAVLQARRLAVIRASVDGFHNPSSIRHGRGRTSPDGFYRDSYDYDALRRLLLDPLDVHGDRRIVRKVYDVHDERPVPHTVEIASAPSVLVFDGIFLHRPELRDYWHYSVFLDVEFSVSVPRVAQRDGSDPDPAAESNSRYVDGQRQYLRTCDPRQHATVVIDNNDFMRASITRRK
ncbi:MAG TPA: hypothetical protein VGR26_17825 [Acidimicrobiales bacterium]|nr:hypothetical protein [Acidimicrobiales bacterium]